MAPGGWVMFKLARLPGCATACSGPWRWRACGPFRVGGAGPLWDSFSESGAAFLLVGVPALGPVTVDKLAT